MKDLIRYYLAIFFRRFHYFVLIFGLFTAVSFTAAQLLPAVYVANSRLLVESAQIPTSLAASTVQTAAAEELQIIEQRLMTRLNLLRIAREQNVFEDMASMSADEIVEAMRDATIIRRFAGNNQATLMHIEFEARSGQIAAAVVNDFVTLVLQESAENRTQRAGDTLQFFELEVERLGNELEKQSARILDFKNANSDALPSTLAFRLQQQSTLQARLLTTEQQIANLQEQRRRLEEVFEKTGRVGNAANVNLTPEQQRMANLQNQLRDALAIYSPENPKVKVLRAQIAQLEPLIAGQDGEAAAADPQATLFDLQITGIDTQIDVLQQQAVQTQQQLEKLNETIERTPANQIHLDALTRDYTNIQDQYNTAVARLAQAATGERIELLSKGQKITVIEPATIPSEPARPNRPLIAFGGSALGAFLGLGLIAALEFLNASIRRPTDITRKLGITPLATIPYIRTPLEQVVRRAAVVAVMAIVLIGIPAVLYAVHTYYLPLDLIYAKIADRVSDML